MKLRFILPFIIALSLIMVLKRGLHQDPREIPSPLINQSTPTFSWPTLFNKKRVDQTIFLHHVSLLNVWATWCEACADEHAFLLQLATDKRIHLLGLDYKDDSKAAQKWLLSQGNPYKIVGTDVAGKYAIDWGVYGTPETFIIDKHGIIRYKFIGPIDAARWNTVQPLINQLADEPE